MKLFARKTPSTKRKKSPLITVTNPLSIVSEQFRSIRTNIQYASIDKELKSLMITSASQDEGKSITSANLAAVFASENKKVLLVDADLRKPTIHRTFNMPNEVGLTTIISGENDNLNEVIQYNQESGLYLLASGPKPPNPAEILGSNRMAKVMEILDENFDLVIYDLPPILAVADAQIIASKVDGVILVVRYGQSEKELVSKSIELLEVSQANTLGVVFNAVEENSGSYNYSYYNDGV